MTALEGQSCFRVTASSECWNMISIQNAVLFAMIHHYSLLRNKGSIRENYDPKSWARRGTFLPQYQSAYSFSLPMLEWLRDQETNNLRIACPKIPAQKQEGKNIPSQSENMNTCSDGKPRLLHFWTKVLFLRIGLWSWVGLLKEDVLLLHCMT